MNYAKKRCLIKRFLCATVLLLLSSNLWTQERIVQTFDDGWQEFDSAVGKPWLEGYVKNGWLGDRPPYIMPAISFQMGPARIYRREGDVISGKYALGVVTGDQPLNILSNCGTTFTPRRAKSQVSAWIKGKGTVRFRIYAYNSEKRCVDTPFIGTFEVSPEWRLYRARYEPNQLDIKEWSVILEVAPNSSMDIDDIAIGGFTGREIIMPSGVPQAAADFEKVAAAFPAGKPIQVDGKLAEPEWQKAEWNSGFLRHKDQANLTPVQAQFAFLYDEKNLYFAFVSAEGGKDAADIKPTPPGTWPGGEPVELFLDPGATRDTYYQFAANILGGTYESVKMDASWDCAWQAAGSAEGNRFIIEAAIPFSAFGRGMPKSGELWSLNVCRNGPYMGPWAPVGPAYHTPSGFGLLVFGTYEEWWKKGFLPSSEKRLGELRGIKGIAEDTSLSGQVNIAEELLKELHSKAEIDSTALNRGGFIALFHRAEQVRTMLDNAMKEWSWVQAMKAATIK